MAAEDNQEAASVLVMLSTKGPKDLTWPERRITLTRDMPTMPIGRASKVKSKGFVASKTNGWFDSPVMSRDHAELIADLDNRTVSIRDIGSLHGTFLNQESERIDKKTDRRLTTGDTIKFGVPISRGKDAYAPTTVDVDLEFMELVATVEATRNVFKVPDYNSDIEDSDSESELDQEPDTTIHTGVFFNNQSSDHIDLTKDDEKHAEALPGIVQLDGPASHRVIDLTSPLREESVEPSLSGCDEDREVSEDIASLVASEDQSHSESEADFDADLSICLTDEENGADFSEEDTDSDVEDSEESEDIEEDDFSSDDEPIADGAHGLMTWPEIDNKPAAQHLANKLVHEPNHRAYHDVLDASLPSLNLPILATPLLPSILSNAPPMPTTTPLPSINAPVLREPSPSDAAMMKSSVQPQTITQPTVEILKEKTGKHAFFEAREENKAALARQTQKYPSPPNVPQAMPASNDLLPRKSVWRAQAMLNGQESIDSVQAAPSSQPVVKSPWLSAGDDFLNSPQESRNPSRDQVQPENEAEAENEAMTSAYQYHLWKQSRIGASQSTDPNSRRIGINDIVMEQELCEQPVKSAELQETSKKRRAAAISTATQEEQAWHDEQQNETPTTDAVVQPISPPASPVGTTAQLASETPRPTKRMRRIAERVGYAALGGATVGAMIVTSLIYTAPSFA